jgi:SP family facilitated glucose transporter-like MFS transporter 8
MFGFTISFTSPAQATMEGDEAGTSGVYPPDGLSVMSPATFSWYAALLNIGAVAGAFSGAPLSDRFGRKKTLVLTAFPHLIGWIGSSFASNGSLLVVLRMLIGWGVGVGTAVTPVYIGEVSTTGLRGALGAANQLSCTAGIFLVNFVGTYIFTEQLDGQTFTQWRYICLLGAAITLLLGTVLVLPESPKWLAKQGKVDESKAALRRLRAGDCSGEAQAIIAEMSQQDTGPSGAGVAGLGQYRKSLVIGIGLCMFQQLGGVNAVMMYAGKICAEAGMTNANAMALGIMGLQVVLTAISCILMEYAGRRGLLLFGSICMVTGHVVLAYYFLSLDVGGMWGPSWLAMVGLGIFIVGFSLALGPIPWLILAELFPTEVRGTCCSIATAANWGCSFIVCLAFSGLQAALTKEGTFLLFAFVMTACLCFVFFLVPETKGKSVEEVLEELGSGARAREVSMHREEWPTARQTQVQVVSVQ